MTASGSALRLKNLIIIGVPLLCALVGSLVSIFRASLILSFSKIGRLQHASDFVPTTATSTSPGSSSQTPPSDSSSPLAAAATAVGDNVDGRSDRSIPDNEAVATQILRGDYPPSFPKNEEWSMTFAPGGLGVDRVKALKHCWVDTDVYKQHFRQSGGNYYIVSRKHKLLYALVPKSGSSTSRETMAKYFDSPISLVHVKNITHEVQVEGYMLFTLVRDPLNRFYSQFDETFAQSAPWRGKMPKGTNPYPLLHENMETYHDYEDIFCPPHTRKRRRECEFRKTQENGTLAARVERFVNEYDGLSPFEIHLGLQLPFVTFRKTGRVIPLTDIFDTKQIKEVWESIAAKQGVNMTDGIVVGRTYPRRFDINLVSNATKQRICAQSMLDYCCLNLPLPPPCADLYCTLTNKPASDGLRIEPQNHPSKVAPTQEESAKSVTQTLSVSTNDALATSILKGDTSPQSKTVVFTPGKLDGMTNVETLKHCYADIAVYKKHFRAHSQNRFLVSEKHKLIYLQQPKSGSSTGKYMMMNKFGSKGEEKVDNVTHEALHNNYTLLTFVRDPLSRFFSQYDESYVQASPWRTQGQKSHPFPYLHKGMSSYDDYEDIFCPPETRKSREECKFRPTQENGTLVARLERFVHEYDGRTPFDIHLHLQVPMMSYYTNGYAYPMDVIYDTTVAKQGWKHLADIHGVDLKAVGKHEVIQGRSYPRRFDSNHISNVTKQRICELGLLDYCCLNLPLPPPCSNLHCTLTYSQDAKRHHIQPLKFPEAGRGEEHRTSLSKPQVSKGHRALGMTESITKANDTMAAKVLKGEQSLQGSLVFSPGYLNGLTNVDTLRHCYADVNVYRRHFRTDAMNHYLVSEEHNMIYLQMPKSGSSTGKHMMINKFGSKGEVSVRNVTHEALDNNFTLMTFVRDPLSRFFSQYDESYAQTAPWRTHGHKNHPFPFLHENMSSYQDYEDVFCPPETRQTRRECAMRSTQENGTLAARFERFVHEYDGRSPFDVHLHLQVPMMSYYQTGGPFPMDVIYDTTVAKAGWQHLADIHRVDLKAKGKEEVIQGRAYPRRFDHARISNYTKQRICELALLDYCCLNLPLPPPCSSLYCTLTYNVKSERLQIEPLEYPHPGGNQADHRS